MDDDVQPPPERREYIPRPRCPKCGAGMDAMGRFTPVCTSFVCVLKEFDYDRAKACKVYWERLQLPRDTDDSAFKGDSSRRGRNKRKPSNRGGGLVGE